MAGRLLLWIAALGAMAGAMIVPGQSQEEWTLVIGGSTEGYLSPCGCVKPMSGGIRRRAALTREWAAGERSLVLELGPLSSGSGRQQEMKAETLGETLRELGADAIGLSATDAALGPGVVGAIQRLSGGRVIASGLAANSLELPRFHRKGPFVIGSVSGRPDQMAALLGETATPLDAAVQDLIAEADGRTPILLLQADEQTARAVAQRHPALALIVYESASNAPQEAVYVGKTALVTPGEKGKSLLRLTWTPAGFGPLAVRSLGPEIPDDPVTARLYRQYLDRVKEERLLDRLPRTAGARFAGSRACISCHQDAGKIWKDSEHFHALLTLELERHDRDPDCVSCHVVGLDKVKGFQDRTSTPQLANVGCESCHGPGQDHASNPRVHPMPEAGERSCRSCHVPEHSPGFDFDTYWPKIAH